MSASAERLVTVTFTNDDAEDARNWSNLRKNLVVLQVCMLTFAAGFGSPIFAPAEIQFLERFKVNQATADSGLAVYVLGFSFGPLFWGAFPFTPERRSILKGNAHPGPMSEMYGRRLPYLLSWPLLVASTIPSAFVDNVSVIIIFRFFAGCFAACASNNGVGIISDMYSSADVRARSVAMAWLAVAFCGGPCLALPIGFFVVADAGPEFWVLRVYFIFAACLLPVVWLLPETHGPTVLAKRAKKLRKSGISDARAAHEDERISLSQILAQHIVRPAAMVIREPIVQGSSIWMALTSAITYLFFEVYPVVFLEQHGFALQLTGLPFISLIVGFLMAIILTPILMKVVLPMQFPAFLQPPQVTPTSPEAIMKVSLIACIMMPISLFWFAWTSGGETHWIVPTLSGIPFAISTLLIVLTFVTYTAHTYTLYTNSANACNSFFRSIASAALAVASHKIVSSLGSKWGVSLFGFFSLGLLPIPIIFLHFGESMRAKSHFAREAAAIVADMKKEEAMHTLSANENETETEKPTSSVVALSDV